jgi:hypothetical protein
MAAPPALPPFQAVSLLAALLVGAYGVSAGLAATGFLLFAYAFARYAAVTGLAWYARAAPPFAAPLEEEDANWAVDLPPEVWALVADHTPSLVGLHRLMGVCKAARAGVQEKLGTLPGLVVCGGRSWVGDAPGRVRDVRKLDLATMRWEPMPALATARESHACCVVRGNLVVLGGETAEDDVTSSVEMLSP